MSYEQAISYLYSSQPAFHLVGSAAYKPGLDNTYRLMEHLGNPHQKLRCIHIAGTNGKGSTSHLIAAALQASGKKVGLYTSPHLVDFRERIRIQGEMISQEAVAQFVEHNRSFLDLVKPSFFETTMAMAFQYFAEQEVDIAVIEVGLGGRLDSTNIITPILSVITNIGLDHTEFLGTTLAAIAAEKAGIIKEHVPVVIGETDVETESVFVAKTAECQSKITFADQEPANPIVDCQLKGCYQEKNIQTAYVALRTLGDVSADAICTGFAHVATLTGLRGRWEILCQKPLTICDTGHNSHGIKYVVRQLTELIKQGKRVHYIFGMVDDKDVDVVLTMLPKEADYYFTQATTHRAIPAEKLAQMAFSHGLRGKYYTKTTENSAVAEAILAAQKTASSEDVIFIGGSNYVVGEAIPLF